MSRTSEEHRDDIDMLDPSTDLTLDYIDPSNCFIAE